MRRVGEDAVVRVCLYVFLEILRALECLSTKVTFVRLERDVDSNVRGDVVALDGGGPAGTPLTGEVEVVGALAADMSLADVILKVQGQPRLAT